MGVVDDDHERDLRGDVLEGERDVGRALGPLRLVVAAERVDARVGGGLDTERGQLPITGISSTSDGATWPTSSSTRLARSARRLRLVSARRTSPNGPSGLPALVP